MELAPQQERAVTAVRGWLADPHANQTFYLAGFAGTGKTTLAKIIANLVKGQVRFCAFTGKASHVLRQKGCDDACTIHSLIYISHDDADKQIRHILEIGKLKIKIEEILGKLRVEKDPMLAAELVKCQHDLKRFEEDLMLMQARGQKPLFRLNPESEARFASLIIVDECSMVDERIGRDLESFDVKILVLGDPAQLPPVGGGGYFTGREPDFLLTDIHRQAAGDPILRIATMARNQQWIPVGKYGDVCHVVDNHPGVKDRVIIADQLLVGRNATRHSSNRRIRDLLRGQGRLVDGDDYPVPGDKLVCLRNNHQMGLLNGSLWTVRDALRVSGDDFIHLRIDSLEGFQVPTLDVDAHPQHFIGKGEEIAHYERRDAEEFAYGYALTVHKAQGSQWDDVVLFDESAAFRSDRWKWLYTGITRAAKSLTIVRV